MLEVFFFKKESSTITYIFTKNDGNVNVAR